MDMFSIGLMDIMMNTVGMVTMEAAVAVLLNFLVFVSFLDLQLFWQLELQQLQLSLRFSWGAGGRGVSLTET